MGADKKNEGGRINANRPTAWDAPRSEGHARKRELEGFVAAV
jgi:hypothetical protein